MKLYEELISEINQKERLAEVNELLEKDTENLEYLCIKTYLLDKLSCRHESLEVYNKMMTIAPITAMDFAAVGVAMYIHRPNTEAEEILKNFDKGQEENSVECLCMKGYCTAMLLRNKSAFGCFERALAANGGMVCWHYVAIAYYLVDDDLMAISACEACLLKDPTNVDLLKLRANIYQGVSFDLPGKLQSSVYELGTVKIDRGEDVYRFFREAELNRHVHKNGRYPTEHIVFGFHRSYIRETIPKLVCALSMYAELFQDLRTITISGYSIQYSDISPYYRFSNLIDHEEVLHRSGDREDVKKSAETDMTNMTLETVNIFLDDDNKDMNLVFLCLILMINLNSAKLKTINARFRNIPSDVLHYIWLAIDTKNTNLTTMTITTTQPDSEPDEVYMKLIKRCCKRNENPSMVTAEDVDVSSLRSKTFSSPFHSCLVHIGSAPPISMGPKL